MDQKKIDEDKLTEGLCDSEDTCKIEVKKGWLSEDWLSLWLGLFIFILSLSSFQGNDLMGWGAKMSVWSDASKATNPVSITYQTIKGEITKIDGAKITLKQSNGKDITITTKTDPSALAVGQKYEQKGISALASVAITFIAMLVIMGLGSMLIGADIKKFAIGFTLVFWFSYLCWFCGHFAYIAATKNELAKFGIGWSLSMTGEFGFIIALAAGLIVGNFFPKLAAAMKEAVRPELYIKTAIVIMGAGLGVKAAESFGLASNIMFRGFCAIVEAYLIYWAVVYYIARRYFKFSREWAAPLASGISICGVSAAIATGGAIRARPIIPIMVSSLVVIFVAVEMIILPFAAKMFLWHEPLVAGAWMGLAVKSDGGAIASGAVTDALIRAQAMDMEGINYAEGWITMTATTVKMFIDIFIGVWAVILAYIWCAKIECKPGQTVSLMEVWNRFPKFVLGYILTFIILLTICWPSVKTLSPTENAITDVKVQITSLEKQISASKDPAVAAPLQATLKEAKVHEKQLNDEAKAPKKFLSVAKAAIAQGDVFRTMFFVLCFFTIGVVSNFKKLMEVGIGKLAAVYCISLFGFIIWIGLAISWLFFHGVKPPILPS
ncbi:MAG: putative sulfate exporter family transporter [Deltaproteobacteria bacterium]|nr:putative sulfate exporter family transporter [Deltaproteobacteria bacterium]